MSYNSQYPQGGNGPQRPPTGSSFFDSLRRSGLYRTRDRWIGGVCGALANRIGWDPIIIRGIMFILAFATSGVIILLYAIAWALLPDWEDGKIHLQELLEGHFETAHLGIGALGLLGLGAVSPVSINYDGDLYWMNWLPGIGTLIIIAVVLLIVFAWVGRDKSKNRHKYQNPPDGYPHQGQPGYGPQAGHYPGQPQSQYSGQPVPYQQGQRPAPYEQGQQPGSPHYQPGQPSQATGRQDRQASDSQQPSYTVAEYGPSGSVAPSGSRRETPASPKRGEEDDGDESSSGSPKGSEKASAPYVPSYPSEGSSAPRSTGYVAPKPTWLSESKGEGTMRQQPAAPSEINNQPSDPTPVNGQFGAPWGTTNSFAPGPQGSANGFGPAPQYRNDAATRPIGPEYRWDQPRNYSQYPAKQKPSIWEQGPGLATFLGITGALFVILAVMLGMFMGDFLIGPHVIATTVVGSAFVITGLVLAVRSLMGKPGTWLTGLSIFVMILLPGFLLLAGSAPYGW